MVIIILKTLIMRVIITIMIITNDLFKESARHVYIEAQKDG